MFFNTSRPTSEAALAQLFIGSPNLSPEQVNSNLFLNSSQGYGYVQDQAKQLGIGDPAQYFSRQQMAAQMARQPNGAQMEASRLAGQYSPTSLPGQLATRDSMWDAVGAQQAQQAQQVASLQTANRMQAYPLPAQGMSPNLSSVMQENMRQRGITNPMEYLLGQRLGPNRSAVGSLAGLQSSVDPNTLFNERTFQNAITQKPQIASGVFGALTGGDLAQYAGNYAQAGVQERKSGSDYVTKAMQEGLARPLPNGGMEWSERVFDPNTNKMTPTGKFVEGNAYQKSQEKYLPYVDRDIAKFQALSAARGTPQVASLQMGAPTPQDAPSSMQTSSIWGHGVMGTLNNAFQGMDQDWWNMQNNQPMSYDGGLSGFPAPTGQAAVHARPLLANNPKFQELARRDPAKARRIILAIQQGGTNPMAP